jgi:hypothetical protein
MQKKHLTKPNIHFKNRKNFPQFDKDYLQKKKKTSMVNIMLSDRRLKNFP